MVEKFKCKNEFCYDAALQLFELAALSYEDDADKYQKGVAKLGYTFKDYIRSGKTEAYIVYDDDRVIVAFPGTEFDELADVIASFDFSLVKTRYGKINRGFYDYYKKINDEVYASLKDVALTRKVYWVGHSAGGSLAQIFATFYANGEVYTYGQPRTGNSEFRKNTDKFVKLYRITNRYDIVTKIPPYFLGHRFAGKEYEFYFEEKSTTWKSLKNKVYTSLVSGLFRLLFKVSWFWTTFTPFVIKGILYHTSSAYRRLLKNKKYYS